MKIEKFCYKSSNLKNNIAATIFEPDEGIETVGIIQIAHGMCEYMKKYEEFANYMTLKGFVVCGEDHLGHGETSGLENLGKLDENDTVFHFVQDIRKLHDIMKKRYDKNLPYHLLGHSMGSFIVRMYMAWYTTIDISSVILCGTSGTQPLAERIMKLLELDMSINGSGSKSVILDKLLLKQGENKAEFNEAVYTMLNSNVSERNKQKDDPYCNFLFSNRAFYILLSLVSRISTDDWYGLIDKNLKILLISGELDAVGGFGHGVREVYSRLCDAGVKDVNYKLYKDARHEILTESIRMSVFSDIYDFIADYTIE